MCPLEIQCTSLVQLCYMNMGKFISDLSKVHISHCSYLSGKYLELIPWKPKTLLVHPLICISIKQNLEPIFNFSCLIRFPWVRSIFLFVTFQMQIPVCLNEHLWDIFMEHILGLRLFRLIYIALNPLSRMTVMFHALASEKREISHRFWEAWRLFGNGW